MQAITLDLWQSAVSPWRPDPADWSAGWRRKLIFADGSPWPGSFSLNDPGQLNLGALRFDGGTMLDGSPAIRIAHENAPLSGLIVTSLLAWNAIKCIAITDLQGDSLTIQNFVDALVELDGADHALNITLDGSKRGKLATGAGDDRIHVLADSNGAAGGNQFVIDSGAGNDLVTIGASTTDWSASFSATAYRESWTSSVVTLGHGDDRFEGDGSNDNVFGGEGDDVAKLGGGNNLFVGGDGIDTLMLDNAPAQYTFVLTADGIVISPKQGGGSTIISEVEIIADQFGHERARVAEALQAPEAHDDATTIASNIDLSLDFVLQNDSGALLEIIDFTMPARGTLHGNAAFQGWFYVPDDTEEPYVETLTYTVRSITGAVSSATLTLTVEPFIPPPYAQNDVAALGQDGTVTIDVLANDLFDGTGLHVVEVGDTAGGSVVINDDGTLTYTRGDLPLSVDSFTYTIANARGVTDTGVVRVTYPTLPLPGFTVVSTIEKQVLGVPLSIGDQNGDGVRDLVFAPSEPFYDSALVVFADPPGGVTDFRDFFFGPVVHGFPIDRPFVTRTTALGDRIAFSEYEADSQPNYTPIAYVGLPPPGYGYDFDSLLFGIGGYSVDRPEGHRLIDAVGVGDLDGDGLDELVLLTSAGPESLAVSMWLVWGQEATDPSLSWFESATPELVLELPTFSDFQRNVSLSLQLAPDDNGDGRPELLLNRGYSGIEVIDRGPFDNYFIYRRGGEAQLLELSSSGQVTQTLIAGRSQPDAVRAADVSGDGVNDLLFSGTHDIETGDTGPGVVLGNGLGSYPLNPNGRFGLDAVGDVNGDGVGDMILTPGGHPFPAGPRIVFGLSNAEVAALPANALPNTGFDIGPDDYSFENARFVAVGDQNGDGLADLLVGAPDYGPAGAAFLVFGKTDHAPVLVADLLARIGGVALLGGVPGARFGENVSALPDMNGDGIPDMYVGDSGFQGGRGQVIYSNADWLV